MSCKTWEQRALSVPVPRCLYTLYAVITCTSCAPHSAQYIWVLVTSWTFCAVHLINIIFNIWHLLIPWHNSSSIIAILAQRAHSLECVKSMIPSNPLDHHVCLHPIIYLFELTACCSWYILYVIVVSRHIVRRSWINTNNKCRNHVLESKAAVVVASHSWYRPR